MEKTTTKAFVVQGVSGEVRNDDPTSIVALWGEFQKKELHTALTETLSDDVICVYHDYRGTHVDPYKMTIGLRVMADAGDVAGLSKITIPAQTMRAFEANGPQPDTLIAQWNAIWKLPLDRTYVADYDVYDSASPDRVTVYVGIAN